MLRHERVRRVEDLERSTERDRGEFGGQDVSRVGQAGCRGGAQGAFGAAIFENEPEVRKRGDRQLRRDQRGLAAIDGSEFEQPAKK